jgi:lysophospholipase L1-like esterase
VEFINAGMDGYTSLQMLKLWRTQIASLRPDLITVYATCNDVIYAPFLEDKNIHLPAISCHVANTLLTFRTVRAIQALIKRTRFHFGKKGFFSPYNRTTGLLRRVSPEDFRLNLAQIVREAQANNTKVVLATAPTRGVYPLVYIPYAQHFSYNGKPAILWTRGLTMDEDWTHDLDLRKNYSVELYAALNATYKLSFCPTPYFKAGYCYLALGDTIQARHYFHLADSLDQQHEIVKEYNQIVREVAAEQGIPLVDLERTFGDSAGANLFAGDGYHPNVAGHALIAEAFYPVINALIKN